MKLFELFESPVIAGANNLKAIAQAATSAGDAHITLGGEPVTLEYPEARFIYGLYKKALQNGTQEQFLQMLTNPASFDSLMKPMRNMLYKDRSGEMAQAAATRIGQPGMGESVDQPVTQDSTLKHLVQRFPKEVKDFVAGDELDTELYHALYDYYSMHGEMPYGTMKGRTGDPFEWVTQRFDQDVHDYITEAKQAFKKLITESKKKVVSERWDDDDDDWYGFNDKTRKAATGGTVTKTGSGIVHKGKYGSEYQGDDEEPESPFDILKTAKVEKEPRGRGRPGMHVKATSDGGVAITAYTSWYHKSKRTYPERKVIGSPDKAAAVVPKGKKFAIVGSWDGAKGVIDAKAGQVMTLDQLKAEYPSKRGRPKTRKESMNTRTRPVREFIEQLVMVVEAKNHMGETEYNTYSGWRAACKRAGATEFEGDRDICQAKKDGKGVGEWDGVSGSVYDDAHKKAAK